MFRAHRTSIGRARAANCPSSSQADRLRHRVQPIHRLTEDALRRAGIARGKRVLDLGCGVGDVSLIAGKVVGPSGAVLGIDNSLDRIDRAERRATESGLCYWVRFLAAEPDTFMPALRFDAVVIRPPLLRWPDALAFLGRSGRGVLLLDLDTVDTREEGRLHAVRFHVGSTQTDHAEPKPEPWPLHPPTMGIAQ